MHGEPDPRGRFRAGDPQKRGNFDERARIPRSHLAIPVEFQSCFAAQRAAYLKAPEPSHAERAADLKALGRLVKDNQAAIVAAINADYGNRSEFETLFLEVFPRARTASTTRRSG